jgi:ribosome-associated translation inhibitor RaiA
MERNMEFRGFAPSKKVRNQIDRLTSRLEKKAAAFSPELRHLRFMAGHNPTRSLYNISIALDLPGKSLAAKEEHHDIEAAIRSAFAEIDRQVEKHKAKLGGKHWPRPERREELRKMKVNSILRCSRKQT